jgi:hydrogenase maturation protein HypF
LEAFVSRVVNKPPPLARIDDWSCKPLAPRGESAFHIEHSEPSSLGAVCVTPDAATCDACRAELFDPRDRRYRYPFLNCTNCGPRLTIVTGVPYDRAATTMTAFVMCRRCRREYDDPSDRRFHAQPTACPDCGPKLSVTDCHGERIETSDPLACFVQALRAGKIEAMKGLGGYHLVCDARNAAAVAEMRRRKHRYEKPFAVMVSDAGGAEALCDVSAPARELLSSPRRPIVLLPKRRSCDIPDAVAPGNPFLGVMLPYTPLHHLLLHDMDGMPLIMTSGNQSDEPIAFDDRDAFERLGGIADLFLTHDRPIHVRCDDSVTRLFGASESPIRRSRGYAPQPVTLPFACPAPILAVGGQLKSAFALGSDRRAVLSHHMGDLDHFEAYRAFEKDVAHYENLFAFQPAIIAHDMHPDYASTRYARGREAECANARHVGPALRTDLPPGPDDHQNTGVTFSPSPGGGNKNSKAATPLSFETGVRLVAVQHHHAHMASCMAEHGLTGLVIGVTFDGSGFGTDGAIWGGEFLTGGYDRFERFAHLRYVAMPGGEQAVREPWRMAVSHLWDSNAECASLEQRLPASMLSTARWMIQRRLNSPMTSSAGRLFDAVACLAGVRDRVTYEGQAAIELEWMAASVNGPAGASYPFGLEETPMSLSPLVIDTRPIIYAVAIDVASGVSKEVIARRFHSTLVDIVAQVCRRIRMATELHGVVLSGGVFMNALLTLEVEQRLQLEGFQVYRHQIVPPNDGGLCLGQVAVAASLT